MDADPIDVDLQQLEQKVAVRADLIAAFLEPLNRELSRERRGSLDAEIRAQRESGGWRRETTPLESGWFSTLQQIGAATSHAACLVERSGSPDHVATGDLLVRAALENLSLVVWLLDESPSEAERSVRALSEVNASTQ